MAERELIPGDDEVGRIRLGLMLRNLRELKGLSGFELGKLAHMSQSKVSKIETGAFRSISKQDVGLILDALDADRENRQQILVQFELTTISPLALRYISAHGVSRKQHEIRVREKNVRLKLVYNPCIIPGLLQTADYMTGLFVEFGEPVEEAAAAVAERLKRQEIIRQQGRNFRFIIGHAALYTAPAGKEVQVDQLRRIIEVSHQANVSIGIIPVSAGLPVNANNGFAVMDSMYATAETVIYEQQSTDGNEISEYLQLFQKLERLALFGQDATRLIDSTIEELTRQ